MIRDRDPRACFAAFCHNGWFRVRAVDRVRWLMLGCHQRTRASQALKRTFVTQADT
jgi:hypothetical protein